MTVQALQNGITEPPHTVAISHSAASFDARYQGLAIGQVVVTIADAVAPTLTIAVPPGTVWTQPDLPVTGTAAPGATVTLTVNNLSTGEARFVSAVAGADGNWNLTLAGLTDGSYELQPEAGGIKGAKVTVLVDSHAPVSTLSVTSANGPNASGWYAGPVNLAISAIDGMGGQGVARSEYTLDGGAWMVFPVGGLTLTQDGNHTVCYRSVDIAGNVEATRCVPIAIDAIAPLVNPLFISASNTLTLNALDVLSGVAGAEISHDGGQNWSASSGPIGFTRDGSYTVQYRVRDNAGNLASGQTAVNVVTVPSITSAVDQAASEGATQTFNLGTFSDQSADSPWTIDIDWGDGSAHSTFALTAIGTLGTQSHTYADSGTYTVAVKVTDQAGNTGSKSFQAAVSNAAPTAVLTAGGPVSEGGMATIAFSNPSDTSSGDTQAGFHYAFACDGASLAGATYANSSVSATAACPFNDNGNKTVRARIIDKDGGFTEYTAVVTVNNSAPTALLTVGGPISEGGTATVALSNQADPSSADVLAGFRYAFACDGSSLAGATYASGGTSAAVSCSYADGPASLPLRARIIDKDGGFTEYTANVAVNNAVPSVSGVVAPAAPVNVNTAVNVSASFSDAGVLDTHTATIAWGDGATSAGTVTEAGGAGSVAGSHSYAAAGSYIVTVTVTDKDGGAGSASSPSVVVIDPAGPSVNGNGRMNSPAGAMPANPGVSGNVNLQVKANYNGSGALTGSTSFDFNAGNLSFQSAGYDWLVVSGNKATMQGAGTVNGSGNYGFVVTVVDGGKKGPDWVRMKIWDKSTGQLVYDSQPGAADMADPATPLSGGKITIK